MSSNVKSPLGWPAKPYKGFNYFRREDQLLLSGRDDEVTACAFLFAHPDTRVLLLHGVTGCGKSSFLRAGLIPALEENAGFFFLKTPGTDDEALFIRCTEAPIDQIARQVFSFASKPFPSESPTGMRQLDLPSALSGLGWEAFLDSAREQNGSLLECLSKIAERLPRTLVLIVDQAEEVLTHSPGEENFLNRARFFEFLRDFQQIETRARIIVTLRTEYFGRFIDAIQISYQSRDELKQFLLSELSGTALVEAALLPTSREQFRSFDPPHSVYGFDFEMGLPETIVKDILSARYSGPALPVLQLVCLGLYEDAKLEHRSLIDREAYRSKGGWEGQILKHLGGAVRAMFGRDPDATSIFRSDLEKLQAFLGSFYVMQDDGTVVARAREMTWVETQLGTLDLHVAPRDVIESLASPQVLILRKIRTVKSAGQLVDELTLGHDSVALAIERWKTWNNERRMREYQELRRQQLQELRETQRELGNTLWASVANFVAVGATGVYVLSDFKKLSSTLFNVVARGAKYFGNVSATEWLHDAVSSERARFVASASVYVSFVAIVIAYVFYAKSSLPHLQQNFAEWARFNSRRIRAVLGPTLGNRVLKWAKDTRLRYRRQQNMIRHERLVAKKKKRSRTYDK